MSFKRWAYTWWLKRNKRDHTEGRNV